MNKEKILSAFDFATGRVLKGISDYGEGFPGAQSKDYVFVPDGGESWTDGFWTGMLLLSYEHTKDEHFLDMAKKNVAHFEYRLDNKIALDHHDIGFLYSPSCVAYYKITGDEKAKEYGIKAAEHLLSRFNKAGGFIQAWGPFGNPEYNFLIIDCLLNIPLLFWATEVTGDEKYADVAKIHLKTSLSVVVRDDFTTHHTFRFDPVTNKPTFGKTAQGYSDNSCWARGQAWGVYGTALAYAYTKDDSLLPTYEGLTKRFIAGLPADNVPYWDMIFTEGNEPRDTSSAAIAACGILEMSKHKSYPEFERKADDMMNSLYDNYTSKDIKGTNIILTDAMYSRPLGHKPEAAIYGDYYFMEALTRMSNKNWKMYW